LSDGLRHLLGFSWTGEITEMLTFRKILSLGSVNKELSYRCLLSVEASWGKKDQIVIRGSPKG
jgi:hypothetical protein